METDSSHAATLHGLSARFMMAMHRVVQGGPLVVHKPSERARRTNKKPWKWLVKAEEEHQKPGWRLRRRLKLGLVRLTNGGGAWRQFVSERLKVRPLWFPGPRFVIVVF